MAGESYTTKKILLKAVDGTTTQYFIPYVNNATADKTGLVKPDGTTITVDANGTISAQVDTSGLQSKIDADHKLSADLISEGTTNKVVTATEKNTWTGKQEVISDLSTIRANATAGAEAASTIAGYGDIVTHDADEFLTEHQDISGKQDKITSTNKLSADLISEGTTNKLVSASEKSAWNNKQDTILDLDTIRSNAKAGAGAATTIAGYGDVVTHDADEFAEATHTHTKSQITDFPTIPTVNDAEIEIQKNGTKVGSFTTNQGGSKKTINLTVPTSAADVSALPASTKYGSTIDLTVDPDTYVVTATLKDQDGAALSSDTIDLPLESVVVSGSYDNTNKKVILTLQSGSTVEFSVADLVSGLQTEITSTNKLSADLIKDGTTNKTVTATEKSTWNSKQDAINDLSTIRTNAEAGAGAATTIAGYGDIVTHNADEFLTEHQDISGKANIADLATVATSGSYADLLNKPTIPTVNDAEIEIQKNGTKVDSFTLNQTLNKAINIAIPTTAADVSALPDSTKYAASLSLSVDPDTYVITGQLKDQDGNNLGTAGTIDLPLESVVVSGSYNSSTKKVVLTLKDGSTVEFSIADLISGLQTEITSTNKLSADLIKDGTTNKTVTATEKATWNAKQAAISDLGTIRTNASNGASAYTTISGYGDIVTHDADEFANADHTHSQYLTSVTWEGVTNKPSTFTPASHNQASSTINALTGYSKSVSGGTGALGTSDTLNKALAKLENALDGKQASGSYATTSDISDMATKTWVGNQGYTSNVGTVTKVNNTAPDANGNVTLSIPSAVTESTVSGWGFTKNAGTVTKVNNVSPVNGNVTLSIPTVTDTYSATSSNAMSGKAVASAISGKADISAIPTVPTALSAFTDDLGSSPTHTHSQYLTSVTAHNQASNTINKMTSYAKASSSAAIATTDSLNTAVGKLEYKIDDVDTQLQALTAMLNAAS